MSNVNLHSLKKSVFSRNKTEKNKLMQNITNEKDVNCNVLIDTEEESQIKQESQINELIIVPANNDLAIFGSNFISRNNKKLKYMAILIIVYIISITIILFSIKYCLSIFKQDDDIRKITNTVQDCVIEKESVLENSGNKQNLIVDFNKLIDINSDTVGWLVVDGIEINMPVVQTDNNEYYLKHSFDKSNNLSGWAFMDFRNKLDGTDKNIIIYGHNRKDNIIFSSLVNILDKEWYSNKENKEIVFINKSGEIENYKIFSIYQIEVEDYYINTNFSSDNDFIEFINTLKARSIKEYNVELNANSPILTLSTCGRSGKNRVILHAQKN